MFKLAANKNTVVPEIHSWSQNIIVQYIPILIPWIHPVHENIFKNDGHKFVNEDKANLVIPRGFSPAFSLLLFYWHWPASNFYSSARV